VSLSFHCIVPAPAWQEARIPVFAPVRGPAITRRPGFLLAVSFGADQIPAVVTVGGV
jgi:hypothetical protein